MDNTLVDKLIELYPSTASQKDTGLFFLLKDLLSHNTKYTTPSLMTCNEKFFKTLLSDDECYKRIEKFYNSEAKRIGVYYLSLVHGLFNKKNFFCHKIDLAKMFNKLNKEGKLNLDEKSKKRLAFILENVSYKKFCEKYIDNVYCEEVENKNIEIPVKKMIEFLSLPDEEYYKLLEKEEIFGIKKECFCYGVSNFFHENLIFSEYHMPSIIEKRFKELSSYKIVDFEAIEDIKNSDIHLYSKGKVSDELNSFLVNDIPSNLNPLEKAIYLYIKACKVLSYDESFYVNNQKGEVADYHKDISNLSKINLSNKSVVCYEFNAIYGLLLDKLGIKFHENSTLSKEYGSGHASLTFRCDKYLITADSVTSIFFGDLMKTKLNQPIVGLTCINTNDKTKKEFNEMVDKVYSIVQQEFEKEETIDFEDALAEYENKYSKNIKLSFEEKLSVFKEMLFENDYDFTRMELINYSFILIKTLFSEEEKMNHIRLGVFKDGINDKNKARLLIAINKKSFNCLDQNEYLLFDLDKSVKELSQKQLDIMIRKEEILPVDKSKIRIPGVEV